jgi:hypothetical protein
VTPNEEIEELEEEISSLWGAREASTTEHFKTLSGGWEFSEFAISASDEEVFAVVEVVWSIGCDLGLTAQQAASLILFELESVMIRLPGSHFCSGDRCGFGGFHAGN